MGATKVKFKINRVGGANILQKNQPLRNMLNEKANGILSNVSAKFVEEFSIEGNFEIIEYRTDRMGYIVSGADEQTTAILNQNPGWLTQFVD